MTDPFSRPTMPWDVRGRLSHRRIDPPPFQSEAELAEYVTNRLRRWFTVDREVPGTMPGGEKVRIDAILVPKEPDDWKDEHPAFGVEFKRYERGSKPTSWYSQAIDYSYTDWDGYGRLGVFMYPDPFRPYRGDRDKPHGYQDPFFALSRVLGDFKVGELMNSEGCGWQLVLHGHHVIWSEHNGIKEGKRWSLRPKRGSR